MHSSTTITIHSETLAPTNPPPRQGVEPPALKLSEMQIAAIEVLITGASVAKAAEKIGVDKGTIYRWKQTDPNFVAALNRWRGAIQAETRDRLLAMSAGATDSVARCIADGDGRLGFQLLDKMRCLEPGPDQPADPYAVFGAGVEDETARRPIIEGFQRVSRAMAPEQRLSAPQLLALGTVIDNRRRGRESSPDLLEMAGPLPDEIAPRKKPAAALESVPITSEPANPTIVIDATRSPEAADDQHPDVAEEDPPRRRVKSRVVVDTEDADPCVRYVPFYSTW